MESGPKPFHFTSKTAKLLGHKDKALLYDPVHKLKNLKPGEVFMQSRLLIIVGACAALAGFAATPSNHPSTTPQPAPAPVAAAATPVAAVATSHAENSREAMVESALTALSSHVTTLSDHDALRAAFEAYYNYKSAHPSDVKKPYLYFVDYGLSNTTPRGYVFDMDQLSVVDGPFIVAHGRGSSKGKFGVPTRFSNRSGAGTSSLGLFVTQETYELNGHAGGGLYHSIALRLNGVSGEFNNAARARGVVMHGAPYVTPSGSGRSLGCPAVELARAQRLIPKLANGSLVFLYSPKDATWLKQDPWVNGDSVATAAN